MTVIDDTARARSSLQAGMDGHCGKPLRADAIAQLRSYI
jgi:hypothetical protein